MRNCTNEQAQQAARLGARTCSGGKNGKAGSKQPQHSQSHPSCDIIQDEVSCKEGHVGAGAESKPQIQMHGFSFSRIGIVMQGSCLADDAETRDASCKVYTGTAYFKPSARRW